MLAIYSRLEADPLEDEVLRREETRELVNATMAQLPPQYRQALEGKYLDRRSVRDLAQANNVSEKAMESVTYAGPQGVQGGVSRPWHAIWKRSWCNHLI